MANNNQGLDITVSKNDFMSKPVSEQNWILLQSVLYMKANGCDWGRKNYKQETWKKLSVLGGAIGGGLSVGGGIVFGIFKIIGIY